MTTMNISLPEALKDFVDQRVAVAGYGTSSEYIRELIRRDKERLQFRSLLLEGAESPVTGDADAKYFDALRAGIQQGKPSANA
ncbi:MAG: type II toxin-antitoxin system ParD family antitoxin [Sulfuricella sp.]|nr:type II toxin-antitoxin system ParD family antitoxin [Sulfuricella sp.]